MGEVVFSGSVVLPELTQSGTADVSAPFSFEGRMAPHDPSGSTEPETLFGSGTATLHLQLNFDGSTWMIAGATYQFAR
jgi:hypothetical protein